MPTALARLVAVVAFGSMMASASGCSSEPSGRSKGDERQGAEYVAIGDSFSAAPGVPVTETTSGCARSTGNFATRLAEELDVDVADASCGGATTQYVAEPQPTELGTVPPQIKAVTEDARLVTVRLGANDSNVYATLFSACVGLTASDPDGAPCRAYLASDSGGDLLHEALPRTGAALVEVLTRITERAPDAEVVLVGYPQLVPPEGACAALPLAVGDYAFARSVWESLAETMADAAEEADVTYLDMMEASRGHDICAGRDAWVNGATDPQRRAAPFHPFAEEQAAVADLVTQEISLD